MINRTENTSVQIGKKPTKIAVVGEQFVADGYHEPLGLPMKKHFAILIFLFAVGGLFFVADSSKYLFNYFSEPTNKYRHEYLEGAVLSLVLATPFWLAVSAFTYPLRRSMPKAILIALNVPGILLVSAIVALTIVPIIFHAFS